jgi:hypothetical protein
MYTGISTPHRILSPRSRILSYNSPKYSLMLPSADTHTQQDNNWGMLTFAGDGYGMGRVLPTATERFLSSIFLSVNSLKPPIQRKI